MFVRSDFSLGSDVINERTEPLTLFDKSNGNCTSIGLKYLYSMLAHGMKDEYSVPIPHDKTITLKNLLGRGATSNVYEILLENNVYAMKMCNSIQNIGFIEYEKSVLEQLSGFPNIPTIITSDTHSITFPVYKPIGFDEMLSKNNMLALVDLLRKIHEKNICHRDLRPENILLDNDQNVVLIDWGYAVGSLPTTKFAGTASFCAEKYASNWLLDYDATYHPRYDCESLLKCFYYLKDIALRLELLQLSHHNQNDRMKLAIGVWKSVTDETFRACLHEIRNGEMYDALKNFINVDEMEY